MNEEKPQPMSGAELELWREQRERETARRATWRAWKRLLVWIAAGVVALKSAADVVKGMREWLFGP